jgi:hypothetical protein
LDIGGRIIEVPLYPQAEVDPELEGIQMRVRAAVSDSLPASILLGTDVLELGRLLRSNLRTVHTTGLKRRAWRRRRLEGQPHTLSEEEEVAPRDSTEQSSRLTHEKVLEVGGMMETGDIRGGGGARRRS